MKILLTGANGFVGIPTCRRLLATGHQVITPLRRTDVPLPLGVERHPIGALDANTDWRDCLRGVDTVIHLAARAHVLRDDARDPEREFDRINHLATVALARQATEAGIRRFVFVSSIKVNGESTPADRPFTAADSPAPADAYGRSKARAEAALTDLAQQSGLSLVILRPPLVHGPGVKGNLASLIKAIRLGLPLPLGGIHNARSLVAVSNLADALAFLVQHDAQGRYLIRDDDNISTPELIRAFADALGVSARLLPVPQNLLAIAAAIAGKRGAFERLAGSLVVNDSSLRALGWKPPLSLAEGLRLTVAPLAETNSVG